MDTNESEAVVEPVVEEEEVEETEPEATESTDWEARAKKLEEKAIIQRERTRTLKERLARLEKQTQTPKEAPKTTGELDENALDYLDLKGVTESEDIDYIQKVVKREGITVRQALKDEMVIARLETNKANREVKAATPSSTKRSGNSQSNDLAIALSRYELTGELPNDFALRSAVVNAKMEKETSNKPGWH